MAHMHATEIGSSLPAQPPIPDSPEPIAAISATMLRAQSFTAASGIALLVREGPALVCRASNGAGALEFGSQVSLDNGFFGLCAGSKKPQKCDDAETDPRIDSSIYGRVKPKSLLAVPVRDADGSVVAVLGVYSTSANAFNNTHIAILRTQADSMARPVQQLPKLPPALSTPIPLASPAPSQPVPGADPVAASAAAPPAPKNEALDQPIDPPKPPAPLPPAPVARPEVHAAPPMRGAGDIEEVLTLADDPAPAVQTREFRVPLPAPRSLTIPAPRTFTLPRSLPHRRRRKTALLRIAGITALCLLAALVTTGWYAGREPGPPDFKPGPPAVPAVFQAEAAAALAAKSPATPARPQLVAEVVSEPPVVSTPAREEKSPKSASVPLRAPEKSSTTERSAAEPVKRSDPVPDPATPAAEVEAPRVALNIAPALPAMIAPAARPPAPRRSEVEPARLLERVAPELPLAALRRKVGGQVVLSAVIRKDGSVGDVKMVSGDSLFRDSAINAVRHWRYSPAMLDGAPVETSARIVLNFNAPK